MLLAQPQNVPTLEQWDVMAGLRPHASRSLRRLHTPSLGRARGWKERFIVSKALILLSALLGFAYIR